MFFRIPSKSARRIPSGLINVSGATVLSHRAFIEMTKHTFDVILDAVYGGLPEVFELSNATTPLTVDGGGQLT
jgi:hypothetical protein